MKKCWIVLHFYNIGVELTLTSAENAPTANLLGLNQQRDSNEKLDTEMPLHTNTTPPINSERVLKQRKVGMPLRGCCLT